nr:uncharacterized protein LOC9271569 isoform X3 [Oryza sativa Japonica Group]
MARRAAEKEAALRQGLTAGDGEARRTGLSWIHGDGSVENRTCRPRPAAAATAPWGSASRRTTAAAWRLRRSSRRARRALAARNSWSCWSCSAASSWCAMTGRAITTAVASQRRNQPKPPPQLKLDGDFRIPEMQ